MLTPQDLQEVCFEKAKMVGTLFCGGVTAPGEIKDNAKLKEAYEMGRNI